MTISPPDKLNKTKSMEKPKEKEENQNVGDVRVGHTDKHVFLQFDRSITEAKMTPNQAIDIGNFLIRHARKVNKKRG